MKTFAQQIEDLKNTIAAKRQRQTEIMNKAAEEGRSTSEDEGQEFDAVAEELKQLDADLVRLEALNAANIKSAKPVAGKTQEEGTASRAGTPFIKNRGDEERFKGHGFVRGVIAKAVARITGESAIDVAVARWGKSAPRFVETMTKAAVPGGGTGSGEWGSELVTMQDYTADFISFLQGMSVFDKLGLREVPANVTIKGQDGTATAAWVGQSKGIPVTALDFFSVNLTPLKVAAIAVISNELLRDSSPSAEALVRDALAAAITERVDTTFLGAGAAVAGVAPAGILNGVAGIVSAGTTADDLRDDIKALYAPFIAARNASGLNLVMAPALAKSIQLMVNAMGIAEFPGINTGGGSLLGDGVVTGDFVGAGSMALVKASDIYRIGDTGIDTRISDVATIEQDTAPTGATDTPAAASANLTSMFQEDSSAIRVIRRINFAKRRASAVSHITGAAYG